MSRCVRLLQGHLKLGCAVQTSHTVVVVRFKRYSNALRINQNSCQIFLLSRLRCPLGL